MSRMTTREQAVEPDPLEPEGAASPVRPSAADVAARHAERALTQTLTRTMLFNLGLGPLQASAVDYVLELGRITLDEAREIAAHSAHPYPELRANLLRRGLISEDELAALRTSSRYQEMVQLFAELQRGHRPWSR